MSDHDSFRLSVRTVTPEIDRGLFERLQVQGGERGASVIREYQPANDHPNIDSGRRKLAEAVRGLVKSRTESDSE